MSEQTRVEYLRIRAKIDEKIAELNRQIDELESEKERLVLSDEDKEWYFNQLSPNLQKVSLMMREAAAKIAMQFLEKNHFVNKPSVDESLAGQKLRTDFTIQTKKDK